MRGEAGGGNHCVVLICLWTPPSDSPRLLPAGLQASMCLAHSTLPDTGRSFLSSLIDRLRTCGGRGAATERADCGERQ